MQLQRCDQFTDESLEQYSMDSLAEPALTELEEHLLICSHCRQRLEATDDYVSAMRGAAARIQEEAESRKRFWTRVSGALTVRRLGWTLAVMALVLAGITVRVLLRAPRSTQPFALVLETTRGAGLQHAPAGRPIDLSLDLRGVPALPAYAVEIVDEAGRRQSESSMPGGQSRGRILLPDRLPPGAYFIRLYSPSRELLREYGLRID